MPKIANYVFENSYSYKEGFLFAFPPNNTLVEVYDIDKKALFIAIAKDCSFIDDKRQSHRQRFFVGLDTCSWCSWESVVEGRFYIKPLNNKALKLVDQLS